MKHKQLLVIFLMMVVLGVILYWDYREIDVFLVSVKCDRTKMESSSASDQSSQGQIMNVNYRNHGIEAQYPKLIAGGSEEELAGWNKIIQEDFQRILDQYAFNPFPELTPVPADRIPVILRIGYEIKRNDRDFISILYKAAFNSPYSAHPTELVYTTNISKPKNQRIVLSDIVKINKDFVRNFRTWDFIPIEEGNEEFNQAIKEYLSGLSDEDLLMGFENADKIGSKNILGIHSYLTTDRLGISLGVPNYIGDHVELEKEISELSGFLKIE